MYIFYISDHKLGICTTILKDYWKGHCIIRVIMWGLFCFSVVADTTKIMHGPFFCSSVFVSVCVFNVWPKTTILPVWPRDTKKSDTPALVLIVEATKNSSRCLQDCYNSMILSPWVRSRPTTSPQGLPRFGQLHADSLGTPRQAFSRNQIEMSFNFLHICLPPISH